MTEAQKDVITIAMAALFLILFSTLIGAIMAEQVNERQELCASRGGQEIAGVCEMTP